MTVTLPAYAKIAAIVPCYNATGDSTVIYSADGTTTILASRTRTVIQRLARSQAVDLAALRARTRSVTERTNLEPLPLAPGLILVPVKIRRPRIAGDSTTGYINLHTIAGVCQNTKKPYQTTITLSGKTEIPVLWTPATVNRQLALARLAANTAPSSQLFTGEAFRETFSGYAAELFPLAIKLIDVFNEIITIKERQ
ncbi:MAG: hypothetical protein H6Q72_2811 [Firmicutes bacterium]|nr:hypothetical protein [Bacillota bacterium]